MMCPTEYDLAMQFALALLTAIKETVQEMGRTGAPETPMYLALLEKFPGVSAEQFTRLVNVLVEQELVVRVGHVVYAAGLQP